MAAVSSELRGSLERDRSNLLDRVSELKTNKHLMQTGLHAVERNLISASSDVPPALPARSYRSKSATFRPALPPRPVHTLSEKSRDASFDDIYEVVDAVPGYDRTASAGNLRLKSSNEPYYILSRSQNEKQIINEAYPAPEDLYEPPLPVTSSYDDPESDQLYLEAQEVLNNYKEDNQEPEDLYVEAETPLNPGRSQDPATRELQLGNTEDRTYVLMECADSQLQITKPTTVHETTETKLETNRPASILCERDSTKKLGKKKSKIQVSMDSVTDPDHSGILKRKKDKTLGAKWMDQTVVVKDNLLFISGKDSSTEIIEFFSLSGAVIESGKIGRQKNTFQIKPKVGKNVSFAAKTAEDMEEWIKVLNRAALQSVSGLEMSKEKSNDQMNHPVKVKAQTLDEDTDDRNSEHSSCCLDLSGMKSGSESLQEENASESPDNASPKAIPEGLDVFEEPKPVPGSLQKTGDQHCAAETDQGHHDVDVYEDVSEEQLVYRAVKSYQAKDDDELSFEVGDLIQVDSVSNENWWSGTRQDKATGAFTGDTGFVPKSCFASVLCK